MDGSLPGWHCVRAIVRDCARARETKLPVVVVVVAANKCEAGRPAERRGEARDGLRSASGKVSAWTRETVRAERGICANARYRVAGDGASGNGGCMAKFYYREVRLSSGVHVLLKFQGYV